MLKYNIMNNPLALKKNAVVIKDEVMTAEGLMQLLIRTNRFDALTLYTSINAAWDDMAVNNGTLDYVIVDIAIQENNIRRLIETTRGKWARVKILLLTSAPGIYSARNAFSMGVDSYLSKYVSFQELSDAMDRNEAGEKYISSDLVGKFAICAAGASQEGNLTSREKEIMSYVAKGYSIAQTAAALHLSQHTIITHRRNIMTKLNVHSAVGITNYAVKNNHVVL